MRPYRLKRLYQGAGLGSLASDIGETSATSSSLVGAQEAERRRGRLLAQAVVDDKLDVTKLSQADSALASQYMGGVKKPTVPTGISGGLSKIGGFFENLGSDIWNSAKGIPAGLAETTGAVLSDVSSAIMPSLGGPMGVHKSDFGEPGSDVKARVVDPTVEAYKYMYAGEGAEPGSSFWDRFYAHPLQPILDVATVASLGAGGAARAGVAPAVVRTSGRAPLRLGEGAELPREYSARPLRNLGQRAVDPLERLVPKFGEFRTSRGMKRMQREESAREMAGEASAVRHAVTPLVRTTKDLPYEEGIALDYALRGWNTPEQIQATREMFQDSLAGRLEPGNNISDFQGIFDSPEDARAYVSFKANLPASIEEKILNPTPAMIEAAKARRADIDAAFERAGLSPEDIAARHNRSQTILADYLAKRGGGEPGPEGGPPSPPPEGPPPPDMDPNNVPPTWGGPELNAEELNAEGYGDHITTRKLDDPAPGSEGGTWRDIAANMAQVARDLNFTDEGRYRGMDVYGDYEAGDLTMSPDGNVNFVFRDEDTGTIFGYGNIQYFNGKTQFFVAAENAQIERLMLDGMAMWDMEKGIPANPSRRPDFGGEEPGPYPEEIPQTGAELSPEGVQAAEQMRQAYGNYADFRRAIEEDALSEDAWFEAVQDASNELGFHIVDDTTIRQIGFLVWDQDPKTWQSFVWWVNEDAKGHPDVENPPGEADVPEIPDSPASLFEQWGMPSEIETPEFPDTPGAFFAQYGEPGQGPREPFNLDRMDISMSRNAEAAQRGEDLSAQDMLRNNAADAEESYGPLENATPEDIHNAVDQLVNDVPWLTFLDSNDEAWRILWDEAITDNPAQLKQWGINTWDDFVGWVSDQVWDHEGIGTSAERAEMARLRSEGPPPEFQGLRDQIDAFGRELDKKGPEDFLRGQFGDNLENMTWGDDFGDAIYEMLKRRIGVDPEVAGWTADAMDEFIQGAQDFFVQRGYNFPDEGGKWNLQADPDSPIGFAPGEEFHKENPYNHPTPEEFWSLFQEYSKEWGIDAPNTPDEFPPQPETEYGPTVEETNYSPDVEEYRQRSEEANRRVEQPADQDFASFMEDLNFNERFVTDETVDWPDEFFDEEGNMDNEAFDNHPDPEGLAYERAYENALTQLEPGKPGITHEDIYDVGGKDAESDQLIAALGGDPDTWEGLPPSRQINVIFRDEQGQPAGLLNFVLKPDNTLADWGKYDGIYVKPEFRNKGIASQMMEYAKDNFGVDLSDFIREGRQFTQQGAHFAWGYDAKRKGLSDQDRLMGMRNYGRTTDTGTPEGAYFENFAPQGYYGEDPMGPEDMYNEMGGGFGGGGPPEVTQPDAFGAPEGYPIEPTWVPDQLARGFKEQRAGWLARLSTDQPESQFVRGKRDRRITPGGVTASNMFEAAGDSALREPGPEALMSGAVRMDPKSFVEHVARRERDIVAQAFDQHILQQVAARGENGEPARFATQRDVEKALGRDWVLVHDQFPIKWFVGETEFLRDTINKLQEMQGMGIGLSDENVLNELEKLADDHAQEFVRKSFGAKKIDGVAVPRNFFEYQKRIVTATDPFDNGPGRTVARYIHLWRTLTLAYMPRWAVNTAVGSFLLNMVKGVGWRGEYGSAKRMSREGRFAQPDLAGVELGNVIGLDYLEPGMHGIGGGIERQTGVKVTGFGERIVEKVQQIEDYFRRASFIHSLDRVAKQRMSEMGTVLSNLERRRGLRTDDDYIAELMQDPQLIKAAIDDLNKFSYNFASLGPYERRYVRLAIPFWGWYKFISKFAYRLPVEYPGRSNILANIGMLGNMSQEEAGMFPEWMRGFIPLKESDKGELTYLSTLGVNPLGQFFNPLGKQGLVQGAVNVGQASPPIQAGLAALGVDTLRGGVVPVSPQSGVAPDFFGSWIDTRKGTETSPLIEGAFRRGIMGLVRAAPQVRMAEERLAGGRPVYPESIPFISERPMPIREGTRRDTSLLATMAQMTGVYPKHFDLRAYQRLLPERVKYARARNRTQMKRLRKSLRNP